MRAINAIRKKGGKVKEASLFQFEAVAWNGGVDFPGVAIDAAIDSIGVFESVAAEPGALVEDGASLVIDEDDEG